MEEMDYEMSGAAAEAPRQPHFAHAPTYSTGSRCPFMAQQSMASYPPPSLSTPQSYPYAMTPGAYDPSSPLYSQYLLGHQQDYHQFRHNLLYWPQYIYMPEQADATQPHMLHHSPWAVPAPTRPTSDNYQQYEQARLQQLQQQQQQRLVRFYEQQRQQHERVQQVQQQLREAEQQTNNQNQREEQSEEQTGQTEQTGGEQQQQSPVAPPQVPSQSLANATAFFGTNTLSPELMSPLSSTAAPYNEPNGQQNGLQQLGSDRLQQQALQVQQAQQAQGAAPTTPGRPRFSAHPARDSSWSAVFLDNREAATEQLPSPSTNDNTQQQSQQQQQPQHQVSQQPPQQHQLLQPHWPAINLSQSITRQSEAAPTASTVQAVQTQTAMSNPYPYLNGQANSTGHTNQPGSQTGSSASSTSASITTGNTDSSPPADAQHAETPGSLLGATPPSASSGPSPSTRTISSTGPSSARSSDRLLRTPFNVLSTPSANPAAASPPRNSFVPARTALWDDDEDAVESTAGIMWVPSSETNRGDRAPRPGPPPAYISESDDEHESQQAPRRERTNRASRASNSGNGNNGNGNNGNDNNSNSNSDPPTWLPSPFRRNPLPSSGRPPNLVYRNGGGRVASKEALSSLQSVSIDSLDEDERTCNICYNDFGIAAPEGHVEQPVRLPRCKHVFGDRCIRTWLQENANCPYCRDKLDSEPSYARLGNLYSPPAALRRAFTVIHRRGQNGSLDFNEYGPFLTAEEAMLFADEHSSRLGRPGRPGRMGRPQYSQMNMSPFRDATSSTNTAGQPASRGERRAAPPIDPEEESRRRVRRRHASFHRITSTTTSNSNTGPSTGSTVYTGPTPQSGARPMSYNPYFGYQQTQQVQSAPSNDEDDSYPDMSRNEGHDVPRVPETSSTANSRGSLARTNLAGGFGVQRPLFSTQDWNQPRPMPFIAPSSSQSQNQGQNQGQTQDASIPPGSNVLPLPTTMTPTTMTPTTTSTAPTATALPPATGRLVFTSPFNQQLPPMANRGTQTNLPTFHTLSAQRPLARAAMSVSFMSVRSSLFGGNEPTAQSNSTNGNNGNNGNTFNGGDNGTTLNPNPASNYPSP